MSGRARRKTKNNDAPAARSLWQRHWLRALFLVAAIVLVYYRMWQAGFIWDDDDYVVLNQTLRDVSGLGQIWFKLGAVPQYYPLVHTIFWFEYHVWGLNPFGYHLVNVLLHALAAVLLWRLLMRLQVPGAWIASSGGIGRLDHRTQKCVVNCVVLGGGARIRALHGIRRPRRAKQEQVVLLLHSADRFYWRNIEQNSGVLTSSGAAIDALVEKRSGPLA